jgi:hypothetical protein
MAAAKKLALGRASYSDLTLEDLKEMFGLRLTTEPLFPALTPALVDATLKGSLERGLRFPLVTEKARSEMLVMPVLMAACALVNFTASVYSGVRFDVLPEKGLRGVCDFILARSPALPVLEAPVLVVVEAKKLDIDLGLGQCAAEMIAAQIFNERDGKALPAIYGCVTTGQQWQFLRLTGHTLCLNQQQQALVETPEILSILHHILS